MKKVYIGCLVLGVLLLILSFWPLVEYQIWENTQYQNDEYLVSPTVSSNILGISLSGQGFNVILPNPPTRPYNKFFLTVPKLHLENIEVEVDSNNFDKALAQLPGTALPGETGNVFISGHSSISYLLPIGSQKAIFNNLTSLKKGDTITVSALGQTFQYVVQGSKVVSPKDVSVIAPPDPNGRYLTLMTCVPPGFTTKRLVVVTKMIND